MFGYTKVFVQEPPPGYVYNVRQVTYWPFFKTIRNVMIASTMHQGMTTKTWVSTDNQRAYDARLDDSWKIVGFAAENRT